MDANSSSTFFFSCHCWDFHLDHVKQKSAFEHAQNAQIQTILHMHKVSSGTLLSIHTYVVSNNSVSGQKAWIRLHGCAGLCLRCPHYSEDMFLHDVAHLVVTDTTHLN